MSKSDQPVRMVMSTNLITVRSSTNLSEIKRLFKAHHFHHLPVVENEILVGIISQHDIQNAYDLMMYRADGTSWTKADLESMTAQDIMTPNPVVLAPEDTIHRATDLFLDNFFHALPVVEHNRLVGIITVHDLLGHYFEYPTL